MFYLSGFGIGLIKPFQRFSRLWGALLGVYFFTLTPSPALLLFFLIAINSLLMVFFEIWSYTTEDDFSWINQNSLMGMMLTLMIFDAYLRATGNKVFQLNLNIYTGLLLIYFLVDYLKIPPLNWMKHYRTGKEIFYFDLMTGFYTGIIALVLHFNW